MDTSIIISYEEYKTFHKIDRELYVRLVTTINKEPIESMQIMAFWLWLEQLRFPNIILKMLSLTDQVVQVIAEEAVRCINCLVLFALPVFTNTNNPMTRNLLEKPISLQLIHDNRDLSHTGDSQLRPSMNFAYGLSTTLSKKSWRAKASKESVLLGNVSGGSDHDLQGSGVRVGNRIMYPAPLLGPGLVHPVYQHPLIGPSSSSLLVGGSVLGQHPSHQGDIGSNLNPQVVPYNPMVPTQTPTPTGTGEFLKMIVRYLLRGYPVTEEEVFEFFTKRRRSSMRSSVCSSTGLQCLTPSKEVRKLY